MHTRSPRPALAALLALCLLPAGSVHAQDALPQQSQAAAALSPAAQAHVVPYDPLLGRASRPLPDGRLDAAEPVLRAAYRLPASFPPGPTPASTARAFLARHAERFGLAPEGDHLQLARVTRSPGATHVRFRQTFAGLPVHDRVVQVNLGRSGHPTMVVNGIASHLARYESAFDPRPALGQDGARRAVHTALADPLARIDSLALVVYPSDPPRLAYHALARPSTTAAEWSVLIDAGTGQPIALFEQTVRHRRTAAAPSLLDAVPSFPATALDALAKSSTPRSSDIVLSGQGFVFDPDPLTTSGQPYAAPYVDADDADVPELNAERRLVTLPDLARGANGLYRLVGPFVSIEEGAFNRQTTYNGPVEADPNAFRYLRSDDRFEAVNIYYHIDRNQRYVQSLGFTNLQNGPMPAYPLGEGVADNSQYWPTQNVMTFGHGGIDDAEDADVILHEYGHALLEAASPGLRRSLEGQSLHEGWSDYWAASYRRDLFESGAVPDGNWRRLFPWDGNNTSTFPAWLGRTLDPDATFDQFSGSLYTDGDIWATALMDIYAVLGKALSDELVLQSHYYLAHPTTYRDAAEAVIQADLDLFDGAHTSVIIDAFDRRGYLDAADFAPVIAHTPLSDTEQLDGVVPVEIDVTSLAFPIDRVQVVVESGVDPPLTIPAGTAGEDRYVAELPLPAQATRIRYYIEAFDSANRRSVLPRNAPNEVFSFQAGPDSEPPRVTFSPIAQASLVGWPVRLSAIVEDNLGVDTVRVSYAVVEASTGAEKETGSFGLSPSGATYSGLFPIPAERLAEGDTVRYRLYARDASSAGNEAVLPPLEAAPFSFVVHANGTLLSFNFEGPTTGIEADGAWKRAEPSFGVRFALSGSFAWATSPGGPYSAVPSRSSLTLPSLDLDDFDEAYLTFWHWYDTEHDGDAQPGSRNALIFDGGNVKASTDGGQNWTILQPDGGYPGAINLDFGNPMLNEEVYGGYSFGWQRAVVPLPVGPDVRVRFDFGTDESNTSESIAFAGWFLDDVEISITRPPRDTLPPVVLEAPPATLDIPLSAPPPGNHIPPTLAVRLADDTGIARVEVAYEATLSGDMPTGRSLLPMSPTDPALFRGTLLADWNNTEPGDRITYRLAISDFDSNTVLLPPAQDPPLEVRYVFAQRTDALLQITSTGRWSEDVIGWELAPEPGAPVSSLVFNPVDLPANADRIQLVVRHTYDLGPESGGNLKLTTDGGAGWTVLAPAGGYDANLPGEVSLPGEPAFTGRSGPDSVAVVSLFDLSAYSGRQVQLRLDVAAPRPDDAWHVQSAVLETRTAQGTRFDVTRELALHPNYPDPFRTRTTITYTLPERTTVRLDVFDALGRRVQVLVEEDQPAGTYSRIFDGTGMTSGLYLVRLSAGNAELVEKAVLLR